MLALIAIFILSAAALAYEILLMRLFSIVEWHHFAFMIISLALLGFGASGTFLTLLQKKLTKRPRLFLAGGAALFGLTSIGSFALAQRLPYNSLEIIWNYRQLGYLLVLYLLLAVPFFGVATSIGAALFLRPDRTGAIYGADLLGAGVGAAALVLTLFVANPITILRFLSLFGFLAAALLVADRSLVPVDEPRRYSRVATVAIAILGIVISLAWPRSSLRLEMSEFKDLQKALLIPGARVIEERSNPIALVSVLQSDVVPLRRAPGLSLNYFNELPRQLGLFSDGSFSGVLIAGGVKGAELDYLDQLTSAAPYHLLRAGHRPAERVLVIGAAGGADVISAFKHGARHVEAVEPNRSVVALLQKEFASFTGGLYLRNDLSIHVASSRSVIANRRQKFDVIDVTLAESSGAAAAGVHALSENFLFTVEGIEQVIDSLDQDGIAAITCGIDVPPSAAMKLIATVVVAMERRGVDPARSLAIVRGWNTATIMFSRQPLSSAQIEALRTFAEERSFDRCWFPGVRAGEANRYHILEQPYLFEAAEAMVHGQAARESFYERYKFRIEPATDSRPYFSHFFQWTFLPELWRLRGSGGAPLLQWGYLLVVAALIQAVVAALIFILLPLRWIGGGDRGEGRARAFWVVIFFSALGVGFLLLEIAFMQRLTLILSHPLAATAVVLAGFLLFAGLGSAFSSRFSQRLGVLRAIRGATVCVFVLTMIELVLFFLLTQRALAWNESLKILFALALIAPLSFFMGVPFPLGLRILSERRPSWISWAWAINGSASVVSAVAAMLLLIHAGFGATAITAALLYLLAAVAAQRVGRTL